MRDAEISGTGPAVIGIFGPSYCGSTVTSYVLGCSPGTIAIGESHWLRADGGGAPPHASPCRQHWDECAVWTPEVTAAVRAVPPEHHYAAIVEALRPERALVVSDKDPAIYELLSTPDIGLIVYKDPRAQLASHLRHYDAVANDREAAIPVDERTQIYSADLERLYSRSMFLMAGRPVFSFSLDRLVRDPEATLSRLSARCGIRYDARMLRFWESDQCTLGGNHSLQLHTNPETASDEMPIDWRARFAAQLSIDDRWKTELDPFLAQRFEQSADIRRLWRWLNSLHV